MVAPNAQKARLLLEFPSYDDLGALELSSFVYDFNRLYVTTFRALNGEIMPRGPYDGRRNNFILPKTAELKIIRLRFESPLLVEFFTAVSAGAGAIYAVLQVLEKADTWPKQSRILDLKARQLELQNQKLEAARQFVDAISRESHPEIYNAAGSISRSKLKPNQIGIHIDREV